MTETAIISAAIALGFVLTAVVRAEGAPESISALVYACRWRWSWTMWLWAVGLSLLMPLASALPQRCAGIGIMAIACLLAVGVIPVFDADNRRLHDVLGWAAGLLSQTCTAIVCPWWLLAWTAYFPLCRLGGKPTFIAEAICAITLYMAVITELMTQTKIICL